MARLLFNLLSATLDADIDDNDTTVTFTGPLKEFGSTNIATISGGDTLTLVHGYELMHVTAYTSGASTATVTRGAEGSTAVAHNEGDVLRHVSTDLDLGGASTAADVSIVDTGGYFTGTDVEAALQELGPGAGGAAVLYVEHGAVASTPRPVTTGPVLWIGTVVPDEIETNDIVVNPDATSGAIVAADVETDDSSWTEIAGVDVQAALDSVDAALGGLGGSAYPRSMTLMPWASKTVTSGTFIIGASDVGPIYQFGTAQNSEMSWDVLLDAGTYKLGFTHSKDSDRGIYSVQFDTVEVGTVDGYNAGSSFVLSQLTGLVIASPGVVEIKLKTATKNASSSSYKGIIGSLVIARTGA